MRRKHAEAFEQFSSTFEEDTHTRWARLVDEWIANRTKPNPYQEPAGRKFCITKRFGKRSTLKFCVETTLQEIRVELAKEDAKEASQGINPPHKTSLTSFLMKGFDLEEQQ